MFSSAGIWTFYQSAFLKVLTVVAAYSYYWMPPVLILITWNVWVYYIRAVFINKIRWTLLEVKIPREILKSPRAMEMVLGSFYQTSEGPFITRYTTGKVRPWFSLELVSFGGEIHFYIYTQSFYRNLIEAQIYAQYPEVEIYEVDDYTSKVPFLVSEEWDLKGLEFTLTKEDAYPIKTYVDYGMDKDPKEEFKHDPMTPVLELLGSIKPGEHIWIQFLIMAAKNRKPKPDTWFSKHGWQDEGKKLLEKLTKKDQADKEKPNWGAMMLTPGERNVVEAVERSISKIGFDVGFRAIYAAKKEFFNPIRFVGLISTTQQYNSANLNGFRPLNVVNIDYPWQEYITLSPRKWGRRLQIMKEDMFDAYINRGYFYPPYTTEPFVLNAEELATVYHFPGRVATTPTLPRIESKRAEPPSNLPVLPT